MEECFRAGHRGSLVQLYKPLCLAQGAQHQATRFDGYAVVMSDCNNPTYVFPMGTGRCCRLRPCRRMPQRGVPLRFNTCWRRPPASGGAVPGRFGSTPSGMRTTMCTNLGLTACRAKLSWRNNINKFIKEYRDWQFDVIDRGNIDEVRSWRRWRLSAAAVALLRASTMKSARWRRPSAITLN